MSKSQKILLTIVLALILFFAYTINVNADNYSFTSLSTGTVTLGTEDRFLLDETTVLVGNDGIITITEGEIEIKANGVDGKYNLTITLKGKAEINENQVLNIINDTYINKADIIIENESTLTINGTLVLPTKNSPTLTNNGTVIISENGVFELRASATYTGSGTTDVYGTFVIFGADEDPNIGESMVNLYETGEIYSRADVKDNIEVAAIEDGYTFSLETRANEYSSSVTNDVNTENATLYFLSKEKVVVEEPGIVDDDLTTDDGETTIEEEVVETEEETTTEEEAVETEDETTTEEEATTEEVTETEDETTYNPTTGDAIMVFAVVFVVALAGIVVTIKMRKRTK